MVAAPFTHVIAHATSFEISSQPGVYIKSAQPVVDAARWAQKNVVDAVCIIGVDGKHKGFSVCDSPTKANTIVAPSGYTLKAMAFVGMSSDAEIAGVTFWKKGGEPGPCSFTDLTLSAGSLGKFCVLTAQTNFFPRVDLLFQRVRFVSSWPNTVLNKVVVAYRKSLGRLVNWIVGDGPPNLGALSAVRTHGAVNSVIATQCTADGFGEHPFYCGNVQSMLRVTGCIFTDCGRTGGQTLNREWEEKERINKTGCPSTPPTAMCTYENNLIIDCGSYPDPKAKSGWMANGAALTVAGFPGRIRLAFNRIIHTHPGGGGIVVYGDRPKIGSYLTPNGFANGPVELEGNDVRCMSGAAAGREAVAVDDCESLTWTSQTIDGTERRVVIGKHIGKVSKDATLP